MGSFLSVLGIVPILWTIIEGLVKAVESPGIPGEEKQKAVMDGLKSILDAVGSIPGIKGKVAWEVVSTLATPIISVMVFIFNKTGVFTKKG